MTNLPTYAVTFLVTEIEGSTKLRKSFPQEMHVAFDSHYQILRESDESDNGEVFKTKGDAF